MMNGSAPHAVAGTSPTSSTGHALRRCWTQSAFCSNGGDALADQERVLPLGAVITVCGWLTTTRACRSISVLRQRRLDLQTGIALGERWSLSLGLMNALDRNYRSTAPASMPREGTFTWAAWKF